MVLQEIPDLNNISNVIIEGLDELRNNWDEFIGEYRVLSLTAEKDNILMWSHYADYHQGAVLCFDFSNDPQFSNIKKVEYDKDGKQLSNFVDNMFKLFTNYLVNSSKPVDQVLSSVDSLIEHPKFSNILSVFFDSKLMPFFFLKKKDWNYENEFRLVLNKHKTNDGFLTFKNESLKEVILGAKCQYDMQNGIIETIQKKFSDAQVYRATKRNGELMFDKA